jgi:F-type H+-transporting ATPase subunit b
MFSTPEFWVLVAFFLLLAVFGKRGFLYLIQGLDDHRQKVTHQLREAERLHDEAFSLLNSYKTKHKEAEKQVEKLLAFAEVEAKELKKTAEKEFQDFMTHKEKAMSEKLAIEKEETFAKLRRQVTMEALAIVEEVLLKDKNLREKLTKKALQKIEKVELG